MAKETSAALILGLKPKGGSIEPDGDEPDTEGMSNDTSAAEDFVDAVKGGNVRDAKDAFNSLFRAALMEAETKGLIKRIAKEAASGDESATTADEGA